MLLLRMLCQYNETMKQRFLPVILALLLMITVLSIGTKALAATRTSESSLGNPELFVITAFDADYHLERTTEGVPTMDVTERITADFTTPNTNHGIYRYLPTNYKDQPMGLKIISVSDAYGNSYKVEKSKQNGNLVLRIGDPKKYVEGSNQYIIHYQYKNPITFYDDHQELYLNINGTGWNQPFLKVSGHVYLPSALADSLDDQQLCYTGVYGSTEQDCVITRTNQSGAGGTVVTTSANNLSYGENLSLILSFKPGTFKRDVAGVLAMQQRAYFSIAVLFGIPLVCLIVGLIYWQKQGRDGKGRGTIIPEYVPPKNLTVMKCNVILKHQLQTNGISAQLIDLAIRGYLIIISKDVKSFWGVKTDYSVQLKKLPTDLSVDERKVIELFFGTAPKIDQLEALADLKNSASQKGQALIKKVTKEAYSAGYLRHNPDTLWRKKYLPTILLFTFGVGCIILGVNVNEIFIFPGVGLLLGSLLLLPFSTRIQALSDSGVLIREQLDGLRMYMNLAEADRITYLQSPQGVKQYGDPTLPANQVKLFEKLLPYAMLFGIENEWAAQFEKVYQEAGWYHGATPPIYFIQTNLSAFSLAAGTAVAPASSSSSGFSGGGFSGGGGGGGGGGGW